MEKTIEITEDYVSFETAKLLKEKGFDGECMCMYVTPKPHSGMGNPNEAKIAPHGRDNNYYDGYLYQCEAPTLQMTTKWLREVHNQIIVPGIRMEDPISGIINCYIVGIWYIPKNNGGAFCYTSPTPYNGYSSFEEACESAIKYCLENLI